MPMQAGSWRCSNILLCWTVGRLQDGPEGGPLPPTHLEDYEISQGLQEEGYQLTARLLCSS